MRLLVAALKSGSSVRLFPPLLLTVVICRTEKTIVDRLRSDHSVSYHKRTTRSRYTHKTKSLVFSYNIFQELHLILFFGFYLIKGTHLFHGLYFKTGRHRFFFHNVADVNKPNPTLDRCSKILQIKLLYIPFHITIGVKTTTKNMKNALVELIKNSKKTMRQRHSIKTRINI